jgi:hypothetical protein
MNARLPVVVVAVLAAPHDIIAPPGYNNRTRIGETIALPRGEKPWEELCSAR